MNRGSAIIVMSAFAAIWWVIGAVQVGRGPLVSAAGIVISSLMVALSWRRGCRSATRDERKRIGRIVGIASVVEGAMIFATVAILVNLGRGDLTAPAIAIIVGLHFLPLARWFPAPMYYLTAVLLVTVGMAGAAVHGLTARLLTTCFGAAAVLWLSCVLTLVRGDQQRSEFAGSVRD